MPSQIRISFAVSAEQDKKIKALSKANGQNISEFCRDRVTGDMAFEELDKLTLENRMENLEYILEKLLKKEEFLSQFIYEFMIMAKSEEAAKISWDKAKSKSE